jgi:hypothetical protein
MPVGGRSVLEIDDNGKAQLSCYPFIVARKQLMTTRIKEDSHSPLAPILRVDLLQSLHALNADYLELLVRELNGSLCPTQLHYLPSRLHPALGQLRAEHRLQISRAPYALYSLRFEDAHFWQRACRALDAPLDVRYAPACGTSLQGPFCETALFEAWQTARAFPLAARLMYAMNESVRQAFAAMPLWQIRRLAADHPSLLMPRWPTKASFWADLLTFAVANDAVRLTAVQLLGTQLIATELATSAGRMATKHAVA